MRNRLFILFMAAVIFVFTTTGRPVENYAMRNPAGSGTVPMSSIYNGLTGTPNPIDASGNLVMTGNVRRGGHFRAAVPYESTTSFRTALGSSSLSSFLRDSAGSEDFRRYAGGYGVQPYYLRSRTVATTRPGYSGVFRPADARINNRTLQGRNFVGTNGTTSAEQQTFFDWNTYTQTENSQQSSDPVLQNVQTHYGTPAQKPKIVNSLHELLMLTRSQEDASLQDRQLMAEKYRRQTQDTAVQMQDQRLQTQDTRFQTIDPGLQTPDLKLQTPDARLRGRRQEEPAGDDEQNAYEWVIMPEQVDPLQSDGLDKSFTKNEQTESQSEQRNVPPQYQMSSFLSDTGQEQGDVIEQLREQLDTLTKTIEARMKSRESESGQKQTTKASAYDYRRVTGLDETETTDPLRRIEASLKFPQTQDRSFEGRQNPLFELSKHLETEISSMARDIRGRYSPESFTQAKFNQHIRAAESYLMSGRYYRAADSFSLASIYKMNDPSCLAGRAHALFAAGEYISSALFLSRVLEAAPEYIQADIDLVTMLGGPEKLESRIADIKEWSGKSGSGKLQFLLGYVYYKTGQLEQAKRAIDIAYEKMPDSPAVGLVKKAIEMR